MAIILAMALITMERYSSIPNKIGLFMNSYIRHKQAVEQGLYLSYSTKEIFGKYVKDRLFRKWHHRYIRERNRDIKRLGKQNQKENRIYFGKVVYTYCFQQGCDSKLAFTCKPRCKQSKPLPLNYAKDGRE